jgi:cyclophilin family peptidyl-prolyl cis-trans isomerase
MHVARMLLLGIAILALAAACWLTGCGSSKPAAPSADAAAAAPTDSPIASAPAAAAKQRPPRRAPVDPIVVLHTTAGDIQVQLFREKAPRTVDNFLQSYAERKFYEGTIFHHIEPGTMIIAGGYTEDLSPKETRSPVYNEARNGLKNKRGTIAMIRDATNAHSATSQFFINLADNPGLDCRPEEIPAEFANASSAGVDPPTSDEVWGYCVFGEVIAGMDVADRIGQSEVAPQGDFVSVPVATVAIRSVEQIR